MYFEDSSTYFDKIVMFSHSGKQNDIYWNLYSYNCSQVGSKCSLYAEIRTHYFAFDYFAEDLFTLTSNKFKMVRKVDGNAQLDLRDWSMYSDILKNRLAQWNVLFAGINMMPVEFVPNPKEISQTLTPVGDREISNGIRSSIKLKRRELRSHLFPTLSCYLILQWWY